MNTQLPCVHLSGEDQCWGSNSLGQLGDGTTEDHTYPVQVSNLISGVTNISIGGSHSCALLTSGSLYCWGYNLLGQLGDGTFINRTSPVEVSGFEDEVIGVSAGSTHTCALESTGNVKCWGGNSSGQLGDGTSIKRSLPVSVLNIADRVKEVTSGGLHTCIRTESQEIQCWGGNNYGQLGDGTTTDRSTPGPVIVKVDKVSSGYGHSCALLSTNALKCWGWNSDGQLGDGTTQDHIAPALVVGFSEGLVDVSAGGFHTCALEETGVMKCWGENSSGQLGDGTLISRSTPDEVFGLGGAVSMLSAGYAHSCAVDTSGALKCWGNNQYGQLGDGTIISKNIPIEVIGLSSGVAGVSAGMNHTCAVLNNGGIKCWGSNQYGQLGDGTTTDRTIPGDVNGLTSGAAMVSAGGLHTCAVLSNGGVKCWGYNHHGQLGNQTTVDRSSPVTVVGLSGFAQVSAGGYHSCAVSSTGIEKCWGGNYSGQLGDGTNTNRSTPVDVSGLNSGVSIISAGYEHSCAVLPSGEVRCWGGDAYGQLGDGLPIYW